MYSTVASELCGVQLNQRATLGARAYSAPKRVKSEARHLRVIRRANFNPKQNVGFDGVPGVPWK
jgi:hypothetical protein